MTTAVQVSTRVTYGDHHSRRSRQTSYVIIDKMLHNYIHRKTPKMFISGISYWNVFRNFNRVPQAYFTNRFFFPRYMDWFNLSGQGLLTLGVIIDNFSFVHMFPSILSVIQFLGPTSWLSARVACSISNALAMEILWFSISHRYLNGILRWM